MNMAEEGMLKESGAATCPGSGSTWLCPCCSPFCATFGELYPCVHQGQDTVGICCCLSLVLQLCPLLLGVDEIPGVPGEPCFSRVYLVFRAVNECLRLCKSPVLRMDSSALALKWSRPLNPVPFECSGY